MDENNTKAVLPPILTEKLYIKKYIKYNNKINMRNKVDGLRGRECIIFNRIISGSRVIKPGLHDL